MNAAHSKVRQHYDEVADIYDSRYDRNRGRLYYSRLSENVLELLPKGKHLLDLGCGTGLFIQHYGKYGGAATGLDLSPGMIHKARSRCRMGRFAVGNAEILPFRDESFDALSSLLAFSYLKEPESMIKEAYRVLKPGGVIAVVTLGKNLLTSGLPALYAMGEAMNIRHVGMGDFGERYYSESEMNDLFFKAGFTDILIRRCSFAHINLIDPLYGIARKIEPFVEERLPYLAYNLLASARKPG
ncbi:MAG: methyltransferase domain-containing protein [Methanoregulaceae archaeon]|nr:methyltransferase domain-containing protein [Methanoregulaceae archaeon]MDD3092160.1 methyltransferase domain-containing protein [Methanoregulaceae archaeon]HQC13025.1 methyltransferase domain-containing protein [Methanoregulaceae archaeon]